MAQIIQINMEIGKTEEWSALQSLTWKYSDLSTDLRSLYLFGKYVYRK